MEFSSDEKPNIMFAPLDTRRKPISASLAKYLATRKERGEKWLREQTLEIDNKLPRILDTKTKTRTTPSEKHEGKDSLWMTLTDVFFPNTVLENQKTFKQGEKTSHYLQPSIQFVQSKERKQCTGHIKEKIGQEANAKKLDEISILIKRMEGMNMHDDVKKIRELQRIKNKTDKVIKSLEGKDKAAALSREKHETYMREYFSRKGEQAKKEAQERHLRHISTEFVYRFAVVDAKRKADSLVRRQKNGTLWEKAYNAAIKMHIDSIKTG